jgi:hypothetical protein
LREEDTVMVIRYADGSYVEGVIYRLEGATMRAAIAGIDDAVEYTLIHDQWISETGLTVTLEFPIEIGMDLFQVMPRTTADREARCAAGGDCVLWRTSGTCAGPVN